MPTFTAFTTHADRARAVALGEALERLDPEPAGVAVIEIEDGSGRWEIGGYFTDPPDEIGLALLSASFGTDPFAVSELPETDWVSKVRRELAPVEAGRFFVYGSHDADRVPEDRVSLLIEAAMAFGTGHHGTTLGCLRALDQLLDAGFAAGKVLDLGCGTAVLGMAAARVWPGEVLASDIEAQSVEVAAANVAANGLAGRVRCIEAAGLDHPDLRAAAPYDLVFANILKGPLIDLAPDIAAATSKGGFAILSGILCEQAPEVSEVYSRAGFNAWHEERIVDWSTLTLRRKTGE